MGKVGKILGVVAAVVGVVALVATGVGAFVGAAAVTAAMGGISAATLMTVAGALSLGASLLAPKPKAAGISADTISRLSASLDPRTPRKFLYGRTALATDIMDQETEEISKKKGRYRVHRFVVVAAHQVSAISQIYFDDDLAWSGGVVQGKFSRYLGVTIRNPGTAGNAIYTGSRMGYNRRGTGLAYIYFNYYIDEDSPFAQNIPTRVTIKGDGIPVYDPRKDSTMPGGSGTQRWNDQTTWQFGTGTAPAGMNPALQLLTWLIGWRINGKLSVGKGIPIDRLDVASFMAAANVCDETVTKSGGGTEPRYQAGGIVSEADDVNGTIDRWKQACNATLDDVDGQIRMQVLVNDLAAVVCTLTENEVLDDYSWKPFEGLIGSANIIRGQFPDPGQPLYQLVDYPEVAVASRDGIERTETVDFGNIHSRSQCVRLAKSRLQRTLAGGFFRATFNSVAWQCQKGDIVALKFAPAGIDKIFRVAELEHRVDGTVPMTLREEAAATYLWDNSDGGDVVYPAAAGFQQFMNPWFTLAQGAFTPAPLDANLLPDDLFGSQWTLTNGAARAVADDPTQDPVNWPVASLRPIALEVPLGQPDGNYYATFGPVQAVQPNRVYYIRCRIAKQVGVVATGAIRMEVVWRTATGTYINILLMPMDLSTLPNDGSYVDFVASMPAPLTAAYAEVGFRNSPATTGAGSVRIEMPQLLDKEPGADVTLAVGYGPSEITFAYDYSGAAKSGEFPRDVTWRLNSPQGFVGSGVTWAYRVLSGKVNGKVPSDSWQGMTTDTGQGILTFNTVESAGRIEVAASYAGRSRSTTVNINKAVDAPPSGGVTSGGGGTAPTGTLGTLSTFAQYSTTGYTELGRVEGTMPAGSSQFTANFNIDTTPGLNTTGGFTVSMKMQQETPFGSNTWTDIGAVQTGSTYVQRICDDGGVGGTLAPNPDAPMLDDGRMGLQATQPTYCYTERSGVTLAGTASVAAAAGANIRVRLVAASNPARVHNSTGNFVLKTP